MVLKEDSVKHDLIERETYMKLQVQLTVVQPQP